MNSCGEQLEGIKGSGKTIVKALKINSRLKKKMKSSKKKYMVMLSCTG